MLKPVRLLMNSPARRSLCGLSTILATALLTGCTPEPPRGGDAALPGWYQKSVNQLVEMNRSADRFFQDGKGDQAATLIEQAQPLVSRLLNVPKPSLAAVEAASDLDDLYGRMLLSNRHYAWAITMFEKNRARWKNWSPQTPETARRLKLAEKAIEECDRRMAE